MKNVGFYCHQQQHRKGATVSSQIAVSPSSSSEVWRNHQKVVCKVGASGLQALCQGSNITSFSKLYSPWETTVSLCGLCLCSYQLHNCQFKPLTSQSALDCTEGFSCLTIATFSVISLSTFPLSVSQGTIRNCKRQERFQRKDSSVWCFHNVACQPLMKKKAFCEERY